MAFKVNYGQQRAERNRAKLAKKEAKQREKEAEASTRKAEPDPLAQPSEGTDNGTPQA